MKKTLLILSLAVLGFQTANAQTFPIEKSVGLGEVKNLLSGEVAKNTYLEIKNTGKTILHLYIGDNPLAAILSNTKVVELPPNSMIQGTIEQLGGLPAGKYLNVVNKPLTGILSAGRIVLTNPIKNFPEYPPIGYSPCYGFVLTDMTTGKPIGPDPTPTWNNGPGKIYTCGKVGINTIDPTTDLEVVGNIKTSTLNIGSSTVGIGHIETKSYFLCKTGIGIDIGDRAPIGQLEINASNEMGMSIAHTATGDYSYASQIKLNRDFTKGLSIYNTSSSKETFLVYGNGNMYAGDIHCHKLKVETNWSDFVFEKNYKLPSLKEVEAYINENKHLPEIPAASEVETTGADVGTILKLHMQKIEELTLYIIQQQKEIEALKAAKK